MKQGQKILLVEDEVLIALFMEMELKKKGYFVCGKVITGEEAFAFTKREKPDLILMDIRLAGTIDGIEAAILIKEVSDVPIIFMTGYPDKIMEDRARKLKPLEYFIKPVRIKDLTDAIDTIKAS